MPLWIPPLIVVARVADVSIGTVRMILVINGHRFAAAGLGFIEVVIWALAVGGVIKYLDNPIALVSYGVGFALGTLIGMAIEEKLALGHRLVQVFNRDTQNPVSWPLRRKGYRVTTFDGTGLSGPVELATIAVKRRALPELIDLIRTTAPTAFVTIERTDRAHTAAELRGRSRTSGSILKRLALSSGQIRK
jgi:uncharacterized protein YebE (UPF0316 family)